MGGRYLRAAPPLGWPTGTFLRFLSHILSSAPHPTPGLSGLMEDTDDSSWVSESRPHPVRSLPALAPEMCKVARLLSTENSAQQLRQLQRSYVCDQPRTVAKERRDHVSWDEQRPQGNGAILLQAAFGDWCWSFLSRTAVCQLLITIVPKPPAGSCASSSVSGACRQPGTKALFPWLLSAKEVSAVVWILTATDWIQGPYLQKQGPQGLGS